MFILLCLVRFFFLGSWVLGTFFVSSIRLTSHVCRLTSINVLLAAVRASLAFDGGYFKQPPREGGSENESLIAHVTDFQF